MLRVHAEFNDGYLDGYDLDSPEPNANRSEAYRHSFAIGRAEKLGKPTPDYHTSMIAAQEIIKKAEGDEA